MLTRRGRHTRSDIVSDAHALENDLGTAAAAFARLETKNAAAEGNDVADDDVEEIQADGADDGDAEKVSEVKARKAEADDDGEAEGAVDPKATSVSEPPPSLSDTEKARFKALPPEAQAFLREYAQRREGDLERHLNSKSGELAETHRQLKAKGEEAVAELGKRIGSLDATIAGAEALIGKKPDWVSLSSTLTPEQLKEQKATWQHVQSKLKAAKDEREKLNGEAKAKFEDRKKSVIDAHKAELLKEFKDPKGIDKAWSEIEPYLSKEGFSEAERGNMYDSRMWKVAHKAALWDKLQAEKKNVRKEAKPAPKLTKPGTVSEPGDRTNARPGAAMARLKKTGSQADAAAAFGARSK